MIPHPERILYPEIGLVRAELALYYHHVAAPLLEHLHDRPLTVRRWPEGLSGPGFYQRYRHQRGAAPRPIVIETVGDLMAWVGVGVIEFHSPLGRRQDHGRHDWAVMDLDPHPPAGWPELVRVAGVVLALLARCEIPAALKTSGADGLHIFLPIRPTDPHEVEAAMERVARVVTLAVPEQATVTRRVADRGPRVYLDFLQNGPKRTMATVYTARAVPEARVSWPIRAQELADGPEPFTVRTVMGRAVPPFPRGEPVDLTHALDAAGLPPLSELRRIPLTRAGSPGLTERGKGCR